MDYHLIELENGIRVIHKPVQNSKITHCGIISDVGSRDEQPHQQGLAHFWEHMAFKGTRKRKAFHILNRIDSVGGELNAYTTKEKICFYASVLDHHFDKAMDLLTDITFDSVFPESQIEKERGVILEEMAMYHDSPEDAIQDEFDQVIFGEHPLGNNILGTRESITSFHRNDFKEFISEHLNTERLIVSIVSGLPAAKVKRLAHKYLAGIPRISAENQRNEAAPYRVRRKSVYREMMQSQVALGRTAYSLGHKKRLPFFLLTNYLGGPAMNSRLNMALREKYGYVYSIEANYNAYTDTGLFGIFFGTEPGHTQKSIQLVLKELENLRKKPFGQMQLHKAKEQLIGQMAMAEENHPALMLGMAKSMLDKGKIDSFDHVVQKIRAISALDIQDMAEELFQPDDISILTYLPK
jgi:predicted Zn-dependent peptidase